MSRKIITIIFAIFFLLIMGALFGGDNKKANILENTVNQKQIKEPEDKKPEKIITETPELKIVEKSEPEPQTFYKVIKVVDGDTLAVEINGQSETLRLIGIDTPETVDPRKPVQCFGIEASNKAKELLNGKMVSLEADDTQDERDKYNRLLRYVFLKDGTNFNKMMIEQGYAFEYTYKIPYKYQTEFQQAEKEVRENKKGLWADDTCANNVSAIESKTEPEPEQPASPIITNCDCASNKYNCTDFKTHDEAQALYNCCIQKIGSDIHRLDANKDGDACESLP